MGNMTIFQAIILGLVQGITEFLPISSSGHLILVRQLLGLPTEGSLAFDAVLQLATTFAVILYFLKDIWLLMQTLLRKLGRLPVNQKDITLVYALLIGTIPAVFFGLLLEKTMDTLFRSPLLVAGVLVAGSILFIYAEWVYLKSVPQNVMSISKGLKIGFFQCLALVPGMSRSGASISGGMLLGLSRSEAARFSFLLSIPVLLGGGAKKLIDLIKVNQHPELHQSVDWLQLGIGSVVAFVTGFIAIHFLLAFVRRNTLWPFIWYRLLLAAFVAYTFLVT
jgi:undecaprenyl-diphosphatase